MQNNLQIPQQIKDFASSAEIYNICEKIGETYNLHIDQVGDLDNEIRGILLGIHGSSDFTDHIVKNLEIDRGIAEKITADVNNEVFKILRTNLQAKTSTHDNSAIERAGGFDIVPEGNQESANGNGNGHQVSSADRYSILSGIENPKMANITRLPKMGQETFTEPLVDHLLQNSTADPIIKPISNTTSQVNNSATNVNANIPPNLPIETDTERPEVRAMLDHLPTVPPNTPMTPEPQKPIDSEPTTPNAPLKLPLQPGPKGLDLYREAVK